MNPPAAHSHRKQAPQRARLLRLRRHRPATGPAPAVPEVHHEGDHPYPETDPRIASALADLLDSGEPVTAERLREIIARQPGAAQPFAGRTAVPELPAWTAAVPGVSPLTAVPVPDKVLAGVRDGSIPAPPGHPDDWFGLTELDMLPDRSRPFFPAPEPGPAAFLRAFQPDGRHLDAVLDGAVRFTRLAGCGDGQVAEVIVGGGEEGPFALAGDTRYWDMLILAGVQAKDALAAAVTVAAAEPEPGEPEAGEQPGTDGPAALPAVTEPEDGEAA
jgi:hypothetical protein